MYLVHSWKLDDICAICEESSSQEKIHEKYIANLESERQFMLGF